MPVVGWQRVGRAGLGSIGARIEAMAGSVNKVILVGNLGKDPEVRNTQAGTEDRQSHDGDQRDLERSRSPASARSAPSGTAW